MAAARNSEAFRSPSIALQGRAAGGGRALWEGEAVLLQPSPVCIFQVTPRTPPPSQGKVSVWIHHHLMGKLPKSQHVPKRRPGAPTPHDTPLPAAARPVLASPAGQYFLAVPVGPSILAPSPDPAALGGSFGRGPKGAVCLSVLCSDHHALSCSTGTRTVSQPV